MIAVKLYYSIQERLPYLDYEDIGEGREIVEFLYKNSDKDDKRVRRMVVVREKITISCLTYFDGFVGILGFGSLWSSSGFSFSLLNARLLFFA